MSYPILRNAGALVLFITTIATIGVMWQPAFWATALPEIVAFVLAAGWLIVNQFHSRPLPRAAIPVLVSVAALWPLIQWLTGTTIYAWGTSVAALYWAAGAAITFSGLQIFSDSDLRWRYLRGLVALAFVMAVIAPLQLFTADGRIFWLFEVQYSHLAMGPFVYPNQYAAFVELILPVALTLVLVDRPNWKPFHGLAAIVMYASILASVSRTGFILTSLEVIAVPLLVAKRAGVAWRKLAISGAVFLGMFAVLGLAIGPEKLVAKLQQKDPFQGRREYIQSSLQMIRDKPLTGVGLGNWPSAYPAYATFDTGYFANQAHSDWAQWAVEGGVAFVLVMLALAICASRRAFRSGWGIGLIVVFLQCLLDYPIQRMGVAVVFFTLLAAVAAPMDDELQRGAGETRSQRAG